MRTVVHDLTAADETFLFVDIAALLGVLGLLSVAAGWAAAKGRLKRNYAVGMRTRTIMRTDETWRVAHVRCAWSMWSTGLVLIATGAALAVLRPSQTWRLALLIAMVSYACFAVGLGAVQADRAARTVP